MTLPKKVTAGQLEKLLAAVRLSPSGAGLQPYRILVIENPEVKEQLREAANGQAQLSLSSHVIVLLQKRLLIPTI